MNDELVNLISKRMIARPDVKARQFATGYTPVRDAAGNNVPWQRSDLQAHLDGSQSFGHYLVNQKNEAKLFAFDIDLEMSGLLPGSADPWQEATDFVEVPDLRAAWHIKVAPPGHERHDPVLWYRREYMKANFMLVAKLLAMTIQDFLKDADGISLDVAVAYSGNKGVHVYAFMSKPEDARQVRDGAKVVLAECDFISLKGDNFYKSADQDPIHGYPNLSIEIFPKQDSIEKQGFGNLLRLPLGKNLKYPTDPAFFLDMTEDLTVMKPTDPLRALTPGNDFLIRG